jgi:HEAT repeat protein
MRTLHALALTLLAAAVAAGQPAPGTPPPAVPTPSPPGGNKPPEWPKEVGGKDLKGWLAELKDSPDGAMREAATKAIPMFGPSARKEAMQPLITAVRRETDPGVKVNLLIVLGNIGPENAEEGKKVVDILKITLSTAPQGSPYKLHAARGLGNCALYAAEAIPELVSAGMDDTAWETRRTVAQVLGIVGRPNENKKSPNAQALTAVSKKIGSEKSAPVRLELVQAMVVMGPPVVPNPADYPRVIAPYFKAINEGIKDEKDKAIQVWLHMLLMLYDGSQLTDATIKKIADLVPGPDLGGRLAALRALAMLDERAKPFVPVIIAALKTDDPVTQLEAMNALAAMREHARPALPELEKIKTTSKNEDLKESAAEAIDIINGKAPVPAAPPPKK